MDRNRQKQADMDLKKLNILKHTETDRKRQKRTKAEGNRLKQSETDRNRQKWTETYRIGHKQIETDKNNRNRQKRTGKNGRRLLKKCRQWHNNPQHYMDNATY